MKPHGTPWAYGAAILVALPFLLPGSWSPVVTALSELWAWGIAGVLLAGAGIAVARCPSTHDLWRHSAWVLLVGVAVAGLLSAGLAIVQVAAPQWLQSPIGLQLGWLPSHLPGRAVAHLRQPNHLATLLIWSAIGLAAWAQSPSWSSVAGAPQGIVFRASVLVGLSLLSVGVVLSGSRTGALGLLLLAVWAWRDRRMPQWLRAGLALQTVVGVLAAQGLSLWAAHQGPSFTAQSHWGGGAAGDVSSSRFAIWANAAALAWQHPWTGVGWGQFNLAWTLTPFPGRPTALFDHAHNISLQWMVELGIPAGIGLSAAAVGAWWAAVARAWSDDGPGGPLRRGCALLLSMVALHSQLEYPLWYAYFLVPSVAAWSLAVQTPKNPDPGTGQAANPLAVRRLSVGLLLSGMALTLGALWALSDYRQIHAIYAPSRGAGPLAHRMAQGQTATWFRAQADYAVATNQKAVPQQPWPPALEAAFAGAPGVLVDARLLMSWAQAYATRDQEGDALKARYLVDRLREFRPVAGSNAAQWLQRCTAYADPFDCQPLSPTETASLHWRSFVASGR